MVLDNMQFQLLVSPNSHALYIYLEFGLNLVSKEHDLLKCITIQYNTCISMRLYKVLVILYIL